jgi:hypothetical protein
MDTRKDEWFAREPECSALRCSANPELAGADFLAIRERGQARCNFGRTLVGGHTYILSPHFVHVGSSLIVTILKLR